MAVTLEELAEFSRWAAAKIEGASGRVTWRDLIVQWNEKREREQTIADILEAHKEYEEGKALPLDEAFRELRMRFGIPDKTDR